MPRHELIPGKTKRFRHHSPADVMSGVRLDDRGKGSRFRPASYLYEISHLEFFHRRQPQNKSAAGCILNKDPVVPFCREHTSKVNRMASLEFIQPKLPKLENRLDRLTPGS